MRQYRQGARKKKRLDEDKENTGISFNEPATNFAIRHTMTNSSSGGSSSTLYAYKYKSGTRFQVPGKIDQVVELLGCESTRGIYGAKQKKK